MPDQYGMPPESQTQKNLIDFLQADLELCFTMLNSAHITHDPEHRRSALDKVLAGIRVIRSLVVRIQDPQASQAVSGRVDELERALESFSDRIASEDESTKT